MARRTAEDANRTREAVIDAALALFSDLGYAAAQLEEIAARARVTRGALYHHFENKADLYLSVLRERWHSVMAPVLSELSSAGDARSRLRGFVTAFLDTLDADPKARALMKMSLSGDTQLPAFASHSTDKLDALEFWGAEIGKLLKEAGIGPEAGVRARALLLGLLGYSVWSSLRADNAGAGSMRRKGRDSERRLLIDALLRGAL